MEHFEHKPPHTHWQLPADLTKLQINLIKRNITTYPHSHPCTPRGKESASLHLQGMEGCSRAWRGACAGGGRAGTAVTPTPVLSWPWKYPPAEQHRSHTPSPGCCLYLPHATSTERLRVTRCHCPCSRNSIRHSPRGHLPALEKVPGSGDAPLPALQGQESSAAQQKSQSLRGTEDYYTALYR